MTGNYYHDLDPGDPGEEEEEEEEEEEGEEVSDPYENLEDALDDAIRPDDNDE